MHVHWTRRGRVLSAVLVERYRAGGKPRQRRVRPLATIREEEVSSPVSQGLFWQAADRQLAALNLDPALRSHLEARLARTVKRPQPDSGEATRGSYVGLLGRLPST